MMPDQVSNGGDPTARDIEPTGRGECARVARIILLTVPGVALAAGYRQAEGHIGGQKVCRCPGCCDPCNVILISAVDVERCGTVTRLALDALHHPRAIHSGEAALTVLVVRSVEVHPSRGVAVAAVVGFIGFVVVVAPHRSGCEVVLDLGAGDDVTVGVDEPGLPVVAADHVGDVRVACGCPEGIVRPRLRVS